MAEVPKTAERAEKGEVEGESAVVKWHNFEERKALLQGLVTAKALQGLEGAWIDFDLRMFKMVSNTREAPGIQEGLRFIKKREMGAGGEDALGGVMSTL